MKICQRIRHHLTMLGIEPTKSSQTFPLNPRLLFGFLLFNSAVLSTALYLVYLVNSILEYIQCFCILTALIEMSLCFTVIVLQKWRLFDYIECMERLINKSKLSTKSSDFRWFRSENRAGVRLRPLLKQYL